MDSINDSSGKNKFNTIAELLRPEGFRRVCRALEHAIGTAEASLYAELLGRGAYFADNNQLDDGYFFNTVIDLQIGTALSDFQQRRAIKQLQELGLISVKLKGSPPKRYFKLLNDEAALIKYLQQGQEVIKALEVEKQKQRQRIEEERLNKQGYFKSEETKDFKSEETKELNLKKLQTNKNKPNKTKKERENPLSISTNKAIEHFQQLNPGQVVSKKNADILKALIKYYDLDTILAALTIHVNEPDTWTKERGCNLSTFNHNMPEYIKRIRERQEDAQRHAAQAERQRLQNEEEQQRESERQQELNRRAALTDAERRLEDINSRRIMLKSLIDIRQPRAAEGCQESSSKLQAYQVELADLAAEENEIIQGVAV